MTRDSGHLLDILRAARLAIEFKADADFSRFVDDLKTQSAILHQLLVIGEAVKRLSPEFRAAHPEVPWKLIAGMRDKLIPFYEGVELEEIWRTTTTDLPHLIQWIEPLDPPRIDAPHRALAPGLPSRR